MRRYELMLLLRPDLDDDRLQSAVERVTRAIVNAGGSLSKVSPWGKRRLAYEIAHHREASYFLIHFDIEPAAVRGIERGLLISEEILRHMVTIIEERSTGTGRDTDGARPARGAARAAEGEPADAPSAASVDAPDTAAEPAEVRGATAPPDLEDGSPGTTAEAPAPDEADAAAAAGAPDTRSSP